MADITQQDVSRLVEDLNGFYKTGREVCGKATPAQMRLLIDRLEDYTQRVKKAASEHKLVTEWRDPWTGEMHSTGNSFNPMFAIDMANWESRLGHYRRALMLVREDQATTAEGCALIYEQVTAPLLDGIYYEVLNGTNLNDEERSRMASGEGHPNTDVTTTLGGGDHPPGHSNAKPPDVISPFTLGNQVLVWKDHQDERLREFVSDLKEAALALPKAISKAGQNILNPFGRDFLLPLGVALLGVSAIVVTGMVLAGRSRAKREEMERESNPGRSPKKTKRVGKSDTYNRWGLRDYDSLILTESQAIKTLTATPTAKIYYRNTRDGLVGYNDSLLAVKDGRLVFRGMDWVEMSLAERGGTIYLSK